MSRCHLLRYKNDPFRHGDVLSAAVLRIVYQMFGCRDLEQLRMRGVLMEHEEPSRFC